MRFLFLSLDFWIGSRALKWRFDTLFVYGLGKGGGSCLQFFTVSFVGDLVFTVVRTAIYRNDLRFLVLFAVLLLVISYPTCTFAVWMAKPTKMSGSQPTGDRRSLLSELFGIFFFFPSFKDWGLFWIADSKNDNFSALILGL